MDKLLQDGVMTLTTRLVAWTGFTKELSFLHILEFFNADFFYFPEFIGS